MRSKLAHLSTFIVLIGISIGEPLTKPPSDDAREDAYPFVKPPVYYDYDCDLVGTLHGGSLVDWSEVFGWANRFLQSTSSNPLDHLDFEEQFPALWLSENRERAERECPLAMGFFAILEFYGGIAQGWSPKELEPSFRTVMMILRRFPVVTIVSSRWPIFPALYRLRMMHVSTPELFCVGVKGVIDWDALRSNASALDEARDEKCLQTEQDTSEIEVAIASLFFTIMSTKTNQEQAEAECPMGFSYLMANQLLNAANKESHFMPPFSEKIDDMFYQSDFGLVAASGWPILSILDIFSDMNKGQRFFNGDRKYMRGFSDWQLRSDELSLLQPSGQGFLSTAWRDAVTARLKGLVGLNHEEYRRQVLAQRTAREAHDGYPLRPIARSLIDCAVDVAESLKLLSDVSSLTLPSRRLVYMVLLYGSSWADILRGMARRFLQLNIRHPLFVIAIGAAASVVCDDVAKTSLSVGVHVLCWKPDAQSQVHRFTALHALLHLGIDVIYMDMDTFLIRDPTSRILAQADAGHDVLFAGHADADCINIGVFFMRATPSVALWFSQFVAWYHDHAYEIDQRGLHVFAGLPSKKMSIAYLPPNLVKVKAAKLEDTNEFVIGYIGWSGDVAKMLIFHWCNMPIHEKSIQIRAAYEAAAVAEAHGISLGTALAIAHFSKEPSPWKRVVEFRDIVFRYYKAVMPEREFCW